MDKHDNSIIWVSNFKNNNKALANFKVNTIYVTNNALNVLCALVTKSACICQLYYYCLSYICKNILILKAPILTAAEDNFRDSIFEFILIILHVSEDGL